MKTLTIIVSIVISGVVYAQRECKTYIPDHWPNSRYIVEHLIDGNIVTDTKTGLIWKQCTEGWSGPECATGTTSLLYTWQEALDYVDQHNAIGYAGYSDWRLPNITELQSLASINCTFPSINIMAFPNTPNSFFWSSTPASIYHNNALRVTFRYGSEESASRNNTSRVRLVRSMIKNQ